jgi:hypothetical protein
MEKKKRMYCGPFPEGVKVIGYREPSIKSSIIKKLSLNDFIKQYDKPRAIVLLEGKRKVLEEDKPKLEALGALLCSNTKYMLFRSGNAQGADEYFSKGVTSIDKNRLQVITPYIGHRKTKNMAGTTISLEEIDLLHETKLITLSKQNKKTNELVGKYCDGMMNRITLKAAFIIRDTLKVLGTRKIACATYGIFYDDLLKPVQGGTGHTIKMCKELEVPFCDQRVWMDWVDWVDYVNA